MEELQKLADSLHPLERKIFPLLKENKRYSDLVTISKLPEASTMRALQWLQNKQLIIMKEDFKKHINLDKNGIIYKDKGLPEQQVLQTLQEKDNQNLKTLQEDLQLSIQEIQIAIGLLKEQALITLNKQGKDKILLQLTEQGKKTKLDKPQKFLKSIEKGKDNKEITDPDQRTILHDLLKRKNIIKQTLIKDRLIELTVKGNQLQEIKLTGDFIDRLTPNLLKTGKWQNKKFRRYDTTINVPKIHPGKKQHYRRFLDIIRQKFLAMGFKEMFGPIVESDFWNMDALFMPQFHSARDIHEAYYIKEPATMKIDSKLINNVKAAHENGFNTGSKGWQYKFDTERTKRTVLRTQDTSITPRTLISKDLKIPGKYFQTVKCFRYDVVDATHLPDFIQTGGFVIEEGMNFGHLKGLLKSFAEEFCQTDQIKIKPAYFPFTEPSAELFAKHPEMGWLELAGSGIFRPEMTAPLGIDIPVIAWGIGIDRVGMFNMKIDDIRLLYSQDLKFLRNQKVT